MVAPLVFLGLLWTIRKGKLPPRAWLLGVGLQGLLVLGALAAVTTGNAEEERVERSMAEARVADHADWQTLCRHSVVLSPWPRWRCGETEALPSRGKHGIPQRPVLGLAVDRSSGGTLIFRPLSASHGVFD